MLKIFKQLFIQLAIIFTVWTAKGCRIAATRLENLNTEKKNKKGV